jgi:hypothetical protein
MLEAILWKECSPLSLSILADIKEESGDTAGATGCHRLARWAHDLERAISETGEWLFLLEERLLVVIRNGQRRFRAYCFSGQSGPNGPCLPIATTTTRGGPGARRRAILEMVALGILFLEQEQRRTA